MKNTINLVAILLILAFITCTQVARAQNVTITKPQKKTTSTSSNSSSSSSSKNTTQSSSAKKQTSRNSSSQQSQTSKPTGSINGHDYVDLGLSVKWATCNVGASSPSDYGDYFAWGETSTKSSYTEENSKTFKKDIENIAGNSSYDAARANWGSTWRLPSEEEIDELISKCKHEWTTQGGHKGYKVTGPNGNSIFLPAAGFRLNTSLNYTGEYGFYWHSPPRERDTFYAFYLFLDSGNFDMYWNYISDNGQSVRPVSE